ncbi:MAG: hypothetical protein PHR35_17255 [Kiritimatiellae bacterium]|nr:hypothetical protein [Kiritimatiellia bacterium]
MDTRTYTEDLVRRGQRTIAWLVGTLEQDGHVPARDLGCSYKCVYPLRLAGRPAEAARLLSRIMECHGTPTGDLRDSDERKTTGTYTTYFSQVYPNGWVTLGAYSLNRLNDFRLLMRGLEENYYNPDIGSFRSACKPFIDEYDATSGAIAVEMFILSDIEKAKRAGDFLIRLMESQPDIRKFFYARMDPSLRCITQPNPRSETYSHIKIGAEDQAMWFLGLPAAALVLLYQATGTKKYLDAALCYFAAYLSCGDVVFRAGSSGKACWAAAMLYRLTGDASYLEIVHRLSDFFISMQKEEGYFLPAGATAKGADKVLYDGSPEYARWFFEVAAEINGPR